jgi:hypothetical protein
MQVALHQQQLDGGPARYPAFQLHHAHVSTYFRWLRMLLEWHGLSKEQQGNAGSERLAKRRF